MKYCHALLNVFILLVNTNVSGGTEYSYSVLKYSVGGTKYFVRGDKIAGDQIFHDRA